MTNDEVAELIHTALYDPGGELVEGGFVDRWESFADQAIADLLRRFRENGYSASDAQRLREAVTAPEAPAAAVAALLADLREFTRPLVHELADSPQENVRAGAVAALNQIDPPPETPSGWNDASAQVRLAALKALISRRHQGRPLNPLLIQALNDADPRLRQLAAENLGIDGDPAAGEELIHLLRREMTASVRQAALLRIARETRRLGVHYSPANVRKRIGDPLRQALIDAIDTPEVDVRVEVRRALERLADAEITRLFIRCLQTEPDAFARRMLTCYPAFHTCRKEALPVLLSLLGGSDDPGLRAGAAFALEYGGPDAVPGLIAALEDSAGPRRAAAMSLGKLHDPRAFSALLRAYADPANRSFERELETAVTDTHFYLPEPPVVPDAAISGRIQASIEMLDPPGEQWVIRLCKERNALPLHSSLIYLWGLQPDGTILCIDHESLRHETEPETDGFRRFAVLARGVVDYPELWPLLVRPPVWSRPCQVCLAQGWTANASSGRAYCAHCGGMGWIPNVAREVSRDCS